MGQAATRDGDEHLAAALLRLGLGAEVCKHDDGSRPSMYDLDVTYPDEQPAAAEVVSTRDYRAIRLADATVKHGFIADPRLARRWRVTVADSVNLKRVVPAIGSLLVELEQRGIDRLPRIGSGDLRERARSISVDSCWSSNASDQGPPGFRLTPGPKGAFEGDSDRIVREIDNFLPTVPDVAEKLRASGVPETHIVVVVTVDLFNLFVTLDSDKIPTTAPSLPNGVDGLWLLAFKGPPMPAIYWMGDGWHRVTLTDEHLSRPLASC